MTEYLIRFKKILGIDNTSNLFSDRIKGNGIFLYECDNIDIDDENKPHRREGDEELVVSGSDKHSIWSNGDIFLYVDGTTLKKLSTDHAPETLITDIDPTDRMCYVDVNGTAYFSNGSIIGYVFDGLPYPFPEPSLPTIRLKVNGNIVMMQNPALSFKIKMIGGQCLEFYNSRLYAANGHNLMYSDAAILTQMDKRRNVIAFPDRITMVKAVLDGIYVGTKNAVFFQKGSDPNTDFTQMQVSGDGEGATEGTSIIIKDDDIGRGVTGRVAYWLSSMTGSVYRGLPGGLVIQCQKGLFATEDLDTGTAILKYDHGYQQYLAVCPLIPGMGGATGEVKITKTSAEGLG